MLERLGIRARVETKFWNAVGNIVLPNVVFSRLRLDKKRLSPSNEVLEALEPKLKRNEDYSIPLVFNLKKRPARFNLEETSSLTIEELQKKREKEGFCHIACAYMSISNEAILRNPQMLSRCASCNGEGVQEQDFSMPATTIA